MDEEEAKELLGLILLNRGIDINQHEKIKITSDVIKEFRIKTNLSIRKIAAITNMNKDKVNKMLNSCQTKEPSPCLKAVIFDLDGTLLDTIEDLVDSMNTVLERYGFAPHGVDEYKYFVGDGMLTLVKRALPLDNPDEETVTRYLNEMREEYGTRWANKTRLYNGIAEMLDGLTAKNIKLAVLSNKPHNFTKIVVEKYLSAWIFEAVLGERTGIPKKPDPTGALEIAGLMGLETGQILYLGDTNVDMKTAVSAGMHAVGASWGFRTVDELMESGAKDIIDHPVELLKLL